VCKLTSGSIAHGQVSHYGGPSFHIFLNFYDGNATAGCLKPKYAALPHVHVSFVTGYYTLFWKQVLTPDVTRRFDVVVSSTGVHTIHALSAVFLSSPLSSLSLSLSLTHTHTQCSH
jgi:hypothetical protein